MSAAGVSGGSRNQIFWVFSNFYYVAVLKITVNALDLSNDGAKRMERMLENTNVSDGGAATAVRRRRVGDEGAPHDVQPQGPAFPASFHQTGC
jgi:hypothetical protein